MTVGAIICETGEGALYGQAIRKGMDLALEEVNGTGGINGNSLRILYRDSASTPATAVKAAKDLYDREDVPLILGGVLSSVTLELAPLAEQRKKILLSPSSSSPEITSAGDYIFRVYPSDVLEGAYMAQLARDELRLEQVTILAIDNAFGRGVAEVFRGAFRGAVPPTVLTYPPRGANYGELVARAEEAGAAGIYLVGYYKDMTALLEEIRVRGLAATVMATSSIGSPRTLEMAGDTAEGVIFPATVFDPESDDPTVAAFVKMYRARYQEDPDLWSAHGYDAVMVAAEALKKAEGPVPARIARQILAIQEYRGPSGTLSFDQYGDVVQYPRAFIVHGGRFELYRDYLREMKGEKEGHSPPDS